MSVVFPFEDLSLVSFDGLSTGEIDGEAEIAWGEEGEWWLAALEIRGRERNPAAGPLWRCASRRLKRSIRPPLWSVIEQALVDQHGDAIDHLVLQALGEAAAPSRSWNAEHRLGPFDAGVPRNVATAG